MYHGCVCVCACVHVRERESTIYTLDTCFGMECIMPRLTCAVLFCTVLYCCWAETDWPHG